jgi:hypothetical protein
MSGRYLLMAAALALAAQGAAADEAKKRGGGSLTKSGGGSSGGWVKGSSGSSGSGSSVGSSGSGSGSSFRPTDAERRQPRPGTGSGRRHVGRYGYGYRYGYPYGRYSWYGDPYWGYWGPYYWGPYYSPGYYGYGYGYGYGHGYGYRYRDSYRDYGSIRLQVEPNKATVYVDGYYAGVVDDFDGIFQRLHVSPGRHEITLKHPGYRTHRMRVYVGVDRTLKIHYHMERGEGETAEDLTGGAPDDRDRYASERRSREDRDESEERESAANDSDREDRDDEGEGLVVVRLDVRPDDASVYVDGEFRGTARQLRRLELPAGRHLVEVVRPGFRTFEREIDAGPGRTEEVVVELARR